MSTSEDEKHDVQRVVRKDLSVVHAVCPGSL